MKPITKKLIELLLIFNVVSISAITSNMTHRVMGTSPLLYEMIDYSKRKTCFEIAPIFSTMYDPAHTNANMILNGKTSLVFDQSGGGDLNPAWLNLMANNTVADYYSVVTFTPSLTQSGALFHWYDQYENMFIDIKTALVQCRSEIAITEDGGGNGLISGILNAQQAFTQSSWDYGKIGQSNHVVGLDNIELRLGGVSKATSNASTYDLFIAGFGLIEAPTGTGTKAEWLFEPQIGTNHWGLGLGFEALVSGGDDLKFMIAGNYRYLIPAWETRSFDLIGNGQWSRYIAVQDMYGLPTAPATLGLPGINFFTQQAYINGRSELNLYTRLQKQLRSSYFEISYNLLCIQKETIGTIKNIIPNYNLYALTGPAIGGGGAATSSTAKINQDITVLDSITNTTYLTSDNLDKLSAAAGTYVTNTLAARLAITRNNIVYGFGASIEAAQSASAISSWAVWAKFEYLFDSASTLHHDDHQRPSLPYGYDPAATTMASDIINNIYNDTEDEDDNQDDDESDDIIDNTLNDEDENNTEILVAEINTQQAIEIESTQYANEVMSQNNDLIIDETEPNDFTFFADQEPILNNEISMVEKAHSEIIPQAIATEPIKQIDEPLLQNDDLKTDDFEFDENQESVMNNENEILETAQDTAPQVQTIEIEPAQDFGELRLQNDGFAFKDAQSNDFTIVDDQIQAMQDNLMLEQPVNDAYQPIVEIEPIEQFDEFMPQNEGLIIKDTEPSSFTFFENQKPIVDQTETSNEIEILNKLDSTK